MLTIIHGDDTASSRTFFINLKKRTPEPLSLEADNVTMTDVIQMLSGGGLFGEERSLFVESLLTKKKKSAELTAILKELESDEHIQAYLWEGKEIDKRTLTSLPNAKTQIFTLPKSLFLFLDGVKPKNPQLLPLFHKTLATVEPEMIFFMLIRQLRLMLGVTARGGEPIEEVKRMPPWQRAKLEKQARMFRIDILKSHYRKLSEIDLAQKTGKLVTPLSSAIDFWLLDL